MSPLLRRALFSVIMLIAVLAGFGHRWRDQRGGTGTQLAFAVARSICPTVSDFTLTATVTDGAQAIDRAALRRAGDLILDRSGCRQPVPEQQEEETPER